MWHHCRARETSVLVLPSLVVRIAESLFLHV
jgi:hypothetical protein